MGTSILDLSHVWLSVIAGGQGTRLFPYSHPERPKQFCQLNKDDKFIQAAIRNFISQGIKKTQVTIATTNAQQTALAKEQVVSRGILSQNINEINPNYGYAGAMVEMTKIIYEIDPEAIIINTPSDQYIIPDDDFSQTIYDAVDEAEKGNFVIVGVKVNDLDTAMGCGHALYEEGRELESCFKWKVLLKSLVVRPLIKSCERATLLATLVSMFGRLKPYSMLWAISTLWVSPLTHL